MSLKISETRANLLLMVEPRFRKVGLDGLSPSPQLFTPSPPSEEFWGEDVAPPPQAPTLPSPSGTVSNSRRGPKLVPLELAAAAAEAESGRRINLAPLFEEALLKSYIKNKNSRT